MMKLARYGAPGEERPGVFDEAGVLRDLSDVVPDIAGAVLRSKGLEALRRLNLSTLPAVHDPQRIGACVGAVGKIICVGLNYKDHAAESGMPLPTEPVLFMKATSSIIGPNDDVQIPPQSQKTDWEVELGVVIGEPCKYVSEARARDHIAGYCIVNDISERAYQLERGGQWDKGKACDTFAPIGPWLVTSDEVPDPQALDLWLEVDGRRVQNGTTASMVLGVTHLVSYINQFMSLQPGDIIATGTPAGVGFGQKPPVYLHPGQTMRLGIAGLGTQQQRTIAATDVRADHDA